MATGSQCLTARLCRALGVARASQIVTAIYAPDSTRARIAAMAPEVLAACTRQVTIPGTGAVESLNVSVAAAVLMWELLGRR